MKRRNPGALATFAWAAGTAAISGLATYYVLREVYVGQIIEQCDLFRMMKQQTAAQSGMQGMPLPPITKDRARAWF